MTAPANQAGDGLAAVLPLFPLQTVLFPGGLLPLKVFEARYLDMVSHCLRTQTPFVVVCLLKGSEVRQPGERAPQVQPLGVAAHVLEVDAAQPGILRLRCQGGQRMHLGPIEARGDGLLLAQAMPLPDDAQVPVPAELQASADALRRAIGALAAQRHEPFLTPHHLDQAGWVANRWCELLPLPLTAKQTLMALDNPLERLAKVDDYLRQQGIV